MTEMLIRQAVAAWRDWMIGESLPLWGCAGFDEQRGSYIERLSFDGKPLAELPRRSMVQARQIYVFSHAALLGWRVEGRDQALTAAHNLIARYWAADGAPGWVSSIHPDGAVADGKRDFYVQAFALYGLAWAYRLSPAPAFLGAASKTLAYLDRQFATPSGGYYSVLPGEADRRDQNPHMHLFEAMLAWYEATGEARFLARAGELYTMLAALFFQPARSILPEYFDGNWTPKPSETGSICQPGHHYEWSWLLRAYARNAGKADEPIGRALKAFADRHGYDRLGLIVDELRDDGSVNKASRRSWPHTEAIKAEVAAFESGDPTAGERAARIIATLRSHYLGRPVAGGWIDHIDADGKPLVADMPASTLYHVFLALAEAHRVWGGAAEASK